MNTYQEIIDSYIVDLKHILDQLPKEDILKVIDTLVKARHEEKTVYICGNGGSASTASHMVCDFSKNTRKVGAKNLKVIGLSDNVASITAFGNDEGYENVFAGQLQPLVQPGDVLLSISGSGNSPNVLRAVEVAKQQGATTIGLAGFQGGQLKKMVDICVVVPCERIELAEDAHLIIDHILTISLGSTVKNI